MAYITTKEAAKRLGVNQHRVLQLIYDKRIPVKTVGRDYLIEESDCTREKIGLPAVPPTSGSTSFPTGAREDYLRWLKDHPETSLAEAQAQADKMMALDQAEKMQAEALAEKGRDQAETQAEAEEPADTPERSHYVTTEQAAKILGVQPARIYRYIRQGRLRAKKMGRDYLIEEADCTLEKIGVRKVGFPKGRPRSLRPRPPQDWGLKVKIVDLAPPGGETSPEAED